MMDVGKFWETMNLLVGTEFRRTAKDVMDDVHDWVEKVVAKKETSVEVASEAELTRDASRNRASSSGYYTESKDLQVEDFIKVVNLAKIECKFSHPHVRSRLEKLMGSNLVSLTDRAYMQKLQERILEDYADEMDKRIHTRENEEMERVKNLVLSGKIPIKDAPASMANHPIMLIEEYCNKLIAERRAKIKIPKIQIPAQIYIDDTPDPPSGLSIENGHVFRKHEDVLCKSIKRFLPENLDDEVEAEEEEAVEEEEEEQDPYMFTAEEYDHMKYESPLIKELRSCETVEEMYALADQIIGVLKTIEQVVVNDETDSVATNL